MIALSRRLIASCLLLMAASLLISLLGLAQGPVPLTIDQVFSALFGDAPRNVAMVVNEWRLPRVLMALLIGAALGVSGAIFQSLTRNPLGSPDVMGFNTGAWSGVLVAMVLFGQNLTADRPGGDGRRGAGPRWWSGCWPGATGSKPSA